MRPVDFVAGQGHEFPKLPIEVFQRELTVQLSRGVHITVSNMNRKLNFIYFAFFSLSRAFVARRYTRRIRPPAIGSSRRMRSTTPPTASGLKSFRL